MSDLSAAQTSQIFAMLEKGESIDPKFASKLRAFLGLRDEETETPAPAQDQAASSKPADVNAGKVIAQKEPETEKKKLDATPQQEVTQASDLLAIAHDVSLPRRIKFQFNWYIPNMTAMFYTLYEVDKLIIRKFKCRRAAQLLCPPMHLVYFSVLVSLHVTRCMLFADMLNNPVDNMWLDAFLQRYPVERLPIPGYLLPFFKAITTYIVQNPQYKRVSPRLPINALRTEATATSSTVRHIHAIETNQLFPNLPFIISLIKRWQDEVIGGKNKASDFAKPWPFTYNTGKTAFTGSVDIAGYNYGTQIAKSISGSAPFSSPNTRYPLVLNKAVLDSVIDNGIDNYILPDIDHSGHHVSNISDWFVMDDLSWFKSFLGPMEEYAALFEGSGSLADVSVDGFATGAYIFQYSQIPTGGKGLTAPTSPFSAEDAFPLIGKMWTTQGSPESEVERLSSVTQIHARLPANHYARAQHTGPHIRGGNVWNASPIYGPSNEITSIETVSSFAARFIKKQFQ